MSDDVFDDEDQADDGVLVVEATTADAGTRLDVVLAAAAKAAGLSLSRTRVKTLAQAGHLAMDGAPTRDIARKLKGGERLRLQVPDAADADLVGEPIPLTVVYEDAHLIVIDKPAGLVVHPAPGHATGTLVNALMAHCGDSLSGIGGVRRPGIVHRLDKDTSGLMVAAKTDAAHHGLAAIFADHGRTVPLVRTYVAFVWGHPDRRQGTIETFLGRHPTDRLRMAVVPEERGRHAVTHWQIEAELGPNVTRLACDLETGRTHQIRVHMADSGHPLLGDPLYGKGFFTKAARLPSGPREVVQSLGRQALHAAKLGFTHPVTGARLMFESALPEDLQTLDTALAGG